MLQWRPGVLEFHANNYHILNWVNDLPHLESPSLSPGSALNAALQGLSTSGCWRPETMAHRPRECSTIVPLGKVTDGVGIAPTCPGECGAVCVKWR